MSEPGNNHVSTVDPRKKRKKKKEARVLAIQNRGDGENLGRRSNLKHKEVGYQQI